MKRWYIEPIPCPDCQESVIPEFYEGYWHIPEHNAYDRDEPCGVYGERIIAA